MAQADTGVQRLRVVSFNVNGIRAVLKRKFNTVASLLQEVQADILCIQETKLRRGELERSLAVVDGWDSFFVFSSSNRGYSGVATYVKSSLALPQAAEVGFTGLCSTPASTQLPAGLSTGSGSGTPDALLTAAHPCLSQQFTAEELQELDSEGRVVVTDHGAFVLFNVYGPALTSEEVLEQRMAFKIRFYQALQLRWASYLAEGKGVVVVGDLNICPAPLDSCSPEPNFYRASRPDRLWLRSLLKVEAAGKLPLPHLAPSEEARARTAKPAAELEGGFPSSSSAAAFGSDRPSQQYGSPSSGTGAADMAPAGPGMPPPQPKAQPFSACSRRQPPGGPNQQTQQ